ncbi:hypothetical protein DID88_006682 [Monilinia fructigena]|uniref:CCHC-type domain-containing protein n=1 Tax=Monilinia fructigena TaxID=38457 RepID=A0A395IFS8_9HELO|nr:hypothetical protein DID88_006682 [Monilinia fructigena]
MADHYDDKPPKIPILDRKNWRQWFKMTKLHIVQKGWGYAITNSLAACFFIQGLPERFNITIEAIDAQNLDFTTKFEKICAVDETAALKKATKLDNDGDTTMAMMAQGQGRQDRGRYDGNRRRSSDQRPRSLSRTKECFYCNEPDHIARDCPHKEGIQAYIKNNPLKESSSLSKSQTSSNWRSRENSPNNLAFRPARDRGYVAAEASDEDEAHYLPSESAYISFHGNTREWIADTGCSSHMTDQFHLLSSLKPLLTPRRIKVRGGELVAKEYGMVEVRWNEKSYRLKALYVPGLGASLLSARLFCEELKAKGAFNDKKMYFHKNGKILLSANNFHGIYVISNIIKNDRDAAFPAMETEEEVPTELEDIVYDESKIDQAETQRRNRLNRYWLWHRRFGHMGYGVLSKLHLVTTLEKDIKLPADLEPCEVCAATKMKKHYSTVLAEHKRRPLALISLDVSGPFPASFRKKRYFAEIICSWTRKTWIICLEKKSDIIVELEKWRIRVERESGFLVGATRTDNAPEIEKIL